MSSPLGTQIPQAVGVAYKKKLDFLSGKSEEAGVSAVYFGDGAASTGDFYSACSFAATLKVPVSKWCEVLLFLILLGFDFDFTMYYHILCRFCSSAGITDMQSVLLSVSNMPVTELFAEEKGLVWLPFE